MNARSTVRVNDASASTIGIVDAKALDGNLTQLRIERMRRIHDIRHCATAGVEHQNLSVDQGFYPKLFCASPVLQVGVSKTFDNQ
jgi:hypothetical protein